MNAAFQSRSTPVWEQHVGSWPLRTLVANECRILSGSEPEINLSLNFFPVLDASTPTLEEREHFSIESFEPSSALVRFAGRHFLIGARRGIAECMNSADQDLAKYPLYAIVLSAEEEEDCSASGLIELAKRPFGNVPVRVITSQWIKEILVQSNRELAQCGPKCLLWETFEEQGLFDFAPQIELQMYYEVAAASSPRLHAKFHFLRQTLTIGINASCWKGLLPSVSVYDEQVLLPLSTRFPTIRQDLKGAIAERLAFLTDERSEDSETSRAYHYFLTKKSIDLDQGPRCCHDVRPPRLIPHSGHIPLSLKQTKPALLAPAAPINLPLRANISDRNCQPRTPLQVIIGCGGLAYKSHGLARPGRRVRVNSLSVSLLGLKLLDLLTSRSDFDLSLVLMVSSWTEQEVAEEVAHLWQQFPALSRFPRPLLLRQNVTAIEGRQADGGHIYAPAGHFDVISWLADPPLQNNGSHQEELVFYCNFNNLGRTFGDGMLTLAEYVIKPNGPMAAFELIAHESRHGAGSYWLMHECTPKLLKPAYFGICNLEDWQAQRNQLVDAKCLGALLMSTGSVMIHKSRLCELRETLQRCPFYAHHVALPVTIRNGLTVDLPTENRPKQYERDIDQLTFLAPGECHGVVLDGFEPNARYFPFREERDFSHERFVALRELYCDLAKTLRPRAIPDSHFYSIIGAPRLNAPWGAGNIREFKGEPKSIDRESESIEFSSHHLHVPMIARTLIDTQPLTDLVAPDEVNVMAKLLDCNEWLSLQVHPNDWICTQILKTQVRSREPDGGGLRFYEKDIEDDVLVELAKIKDGRGKSETFYVVDVREPPCQCANHYLGFATEALMNLGGCEGLADWEKMSATEIAEHVMANNGLQSLSSLIGNTTISDNSIASVCTALSKCYDDRFKSMTGKVLPIILTLRSGHTTRRTLNGIVVVLAIQALREAINQIESSESERQLVIDSLFRSLTSPLLRFFHRISRLSQGDVIHVPPGVVHAAGPGLLLAEFSHASDNTFRVFDHGREFAPDLRVTHYLLAALSLSDRGFVDTAAEGQFIRKMAAQPSGLRPNGFGDVELQKIDGDQLRADKGHTFEPWVPGGDILFCLQEKVTIELLQPLPECDATIVLASNELVTGSAAYIKPEVPTTTALIEPEGKATNPLTVRLKAQSKHTEALCLRARAKTPDRLPTLCIEIGSAHFKFLFDSPSAPDFLPRTHLWHEALIDAGPWAENNWQARKEALRRLLHKFLEDCQNHDSANAIQLLGLSWPGFKEGRSLHSSILECQDFDPHSLVDDLKKVITPNGDLQVRFDLDVDLAAETIDLNGSFRDGGAGILLNFGAAVCMGVCPVNFKSSRLRHLGRLMWFDPNRWKWHYYNDADEWKIDDEIKRVRGNCYVQPLPNGAPTSAIRLSDFLSTTAVAFRFLTSVSAQNEAVLLDVCNACRDELERSARDASCTAADAAVLANSAVTRIRECIVDSQKRRSFAERSFQWSRLLVKYRALLNAIKAPLFHWIGQQLHDRNCPFHSVCKTFVQVIAYDFTEMLGSLLESDRELRMYAHRIVLGGFGGAHFGLHKAVPGRDIFMETLNSAFRQRCPDMNADDDRFIRRSRATHSDYRLVDVCLHSDFNLAPERS